MFVSLIKSIILFIAELLSLVKLNEFKKAGANEVVIEQKNLEEKIIKDADVIRKEVAADVSAVAATDSLPDDGFRRD